MNGSNGMPSNGTPADGMEAPMVAASGMVPGEFNITDFMIDANRDWLFKQEGNKFMSQ